MKLKNDVYAAHTKPMSSHINIGTGKDCTIRELAETLSLITGFEGKLTFDTSKPDGTPRKLMDVSRLNSLGWKSSISLEKGLSDTYKWFKENIDLARLD
jgi:GDP-L-fucose synthase